MGRSPHVLLQVVSRRWQQLAGHLKLVLIACCGCLATVLYLSQCSPPYCNSGCSPPFCNSVWSRSMAGKQDYDLAHGRKAEARAGSSSSSSRSSRSRVTLVTIVKNEGHNLRRMLNSVGDFATDVLLVDQESTDDSVKVVQDWGKANSIPVRVLSVPTYGCNEVAYYHALRYDVKDWSDPDSPALDVTTANAAGPDDAVSPDWILYMDGDEVMHPDLRALRHAMVDTDRYDAYFLDITNQNHDVNEIVTTPYSMRHWRLFRRNAVWHCHWVHCQPFPKPWLRLSYAKRDNRHNLFNLHYTRDVAADVNRADLKPKSSLAACEPHGTAPWTQLCRPDCVPAPVRSLMRDRLGQRPDVSSVRQLEEYLARTLQRVPVEEIKAK
jgi:hypothetical protein